MISDLLGKLLNILKPSGGETLKLKVKSGERLVLENKTYKVQGDIEIEPDGELIIKNCVLKFSKNGGIKGEDCTFIAEDSQFIPLKDKWKNVTLVGYIDGYIKNCYFEGGRGRHGKELNLLREVRDFGSEATFGGALFIENSEDRKKYLIESSRFKNCSASWSGGGVYIQKNCVIKDSTFKDCKASGNGGGACIIETTLIENCSFENCIASWAGGGVYCKEVSNTIRLSDFKNCKPNNTAGSCRRENL
jgi:hypothetical protein